MINLDQRKQEVIDDIEAQASGKLSQSVVATLKALSLKRLRTVKEGFTSSYDRGYFNGSFLIDRPRDLNQF
jgi:hypothetical protein